MEFGTTTVGLEHIPIGLDNLSCEPLGANKLPMDLHLDLGTKNHLLQKGEKQSVKLMLIIVSKKMTIWV